MVTNARGTGRMSMASITDAGQIHIARESDDRLSAAFRDTLEMWYSVSGFKDGEHQEQRRKKS